MAKLQRQGAAMKRDLTWRDLQASFARIARREAEKSASRGLNREALRWLKAEDKARGLVYDAR